MIELLLIAMLFFVFVVGIGAALTLRVAVGWSKELIELQQDGREVTGRVVESVKSVGAGARVPGSVSSTWTSSAGHVGAGATS